jgi:hypothetical protein
MTIVQHCISGDPFFEKYIMSETDPGKIYIVTIAMPGDPPDQWSCTCKGFQYRFYCKHQTMFKPCMWHELDGPEQQTEEQKRDGICPRCGNDTSQELND